MDKLKNLIVDDDIGNRLFSFFRLLLNIDEQDKLKTRMLIQGKKIKRKPSFALDPNAAQEVQNALNSRKDFKIRFQKILIIFGPSIGV